MFDNQFFSGGCFILYSPKLKLLINADIMECIIIITAVTAVVLSRWCTNYTLKPWKQPFTAKYSIWKLDEWTLCDWHTELSGHIIQADVVIEGRVRAIWVAGEEFMTEQTQTLLFPADHFLRLFSIFSVLQEKKQRTTDKKWNPLNTLKASIMWWR